MGRITGQGMVVGVLVASMSMAGCAFKVVKRTGVEGDAEQIAALSEQMADLEAFSIEKEAEAERLRAARDELERRLADEIGNREVSVEVDQRGIVITLVSEVLFDSGKADLRKTAEPTLEKVARVLNHTVPDQPIGIEGHTDNEPIKRSGWRSNWELSTARATSVLHYLVDDQRVTPERVAATGYGEYRPVRSNDTKEGRQQNRRVEIVVLPQDFANKTVKTLEQPTAGEEFGK